MPDLGIPLRDCPATSNCVASAARNPDHRVPGFELLDQGEASWLQVLSMVAGMPRMRVIAVEDSYLHAEETSRVFEFIDDLELHWERATGRISVRSASRVGTWDLGVNRRRVERLRRALRDAGLIK